MGRFEVIVDLGGRARIMVDADFEDQAEEKIKEQDHGNDQR